MALRDTWHRFLVYFGLAVDEEDYEEYRHLDEAAEEEPRRERERERSNVREMRQRKPRDEFDDIFGDEDPSAARTSRLRPVERNGGHMHVHLVEPSSFNDAQEIADHFKRDVPVIINLQHAERDLAKRLIDFVSGLTYALDGGMQRVAEKTFLLTPKNVEVSAEERARLAEKGFFNQS